jgi:hypothetical protein
MVGEISDQMDGDRLNGGAKQPIGHAVVWSKDPTF